MMGISMADQWQWPNGQQAAVSLSYDDALAVHREETAPQLEERGLRGTFYVPINADLLEHRDAWVRVAQAGHELGNHTIFHPCRNPNNARAWPPPHRNLCDYTPARWEDEVCVASLILKSYDGRTVRSFGNTCCNLTLGEGENEVELDDLIARHFVAGRGGTTNEPADPRTVRLTRVGCFAADGQTFGDLRQAIDAAMKIGGWLIFMAHGVGTDHRLQISREVHQQLIDYLAENSKAIWTAPVVDVAQYVVAARGQQG